MSPTQFPCRCGGKSVGFTNDVSAKTPITGEYRLRKTRIRLGRYWCAKCLERGQPHVLLDRLVFGHTGELTE